MSWYFEVGETYIVDASVLLRCYFAFVLPIHDIVLRCGGQLLNVPFSFLSARCIRWPGFVRSVYLVVVS